MSKIAEFLKWAKWQVQLYLLTHTTYLCSGILMFHVFEERW